MFIIQIVNLPFQYSDVISDHGWNKEPFNFWSHLSDLNTELFPHSDPDCVGLSSEPNFVSFPRVLSNIRFGMENRPFVSYFYLLFTCLEQMFVLLQNSFLNLDFTQGNSQD